MHPGTRRDDYFAPKPDSVRSMLADDMTRTAVLDVIHRTYQAMSTPGSDVAAIFGSEDIAIAGSGQGELWTGPDEAVGAAMEVSSWGLAWDPGQVTVWSRQDVAWAQILGSVHVVREDVDEVVPYWTTGVFALDDGRWRWRSGSDPNRRNRRRCDRLNRARLNRPQPSDDAAPGPEQLGRRCGPGVLLVLDP